LRNLKNTLFSGHKIAVFIAYAFCIGFVGCLLNNSSFRIDLTHDKKYSISKVTKEILKNLNSNISIDIYLAGDLPIELKQLKIAISELLEELQVYASNAINFKFVDLDEIPNNEKKVRMKLLKKKGIYPTTLRTKRKGQQIERLVYPGALVTFNEITDGVMLIKSSSMCDSAYMVKESIEGLEYEFVKVINKLTQSKQPKVALLKGHDTIDTRYLNGITTALEDIYDYHEIYLSESIKLNNYDAILIIKPTITFSEYEKYLIDQYIMKGGKVLFFIDRMDIKLDDLKQKKHIAIPIDVGLDDLLFKYGVRINYDLILDMNSGIYPVVVGHFGNQPQIKLLPWPLFPILNHFCDHLITKNLGAITTKFVSSIDPINVKNIKQIPLVMTSNHTKKIGSPVLIDLESLREPTKSSEYHYKNMPVSYLLEGNFTSLFKNRYLPDIADASQFVPESSFTQMMIFASSSVVTNSVNNKKASMPWGYDPFLEQYFSNKDFVLNILDYMTSKDNLISLKKKTVQVRLLNKIKVEEERLKWQIINILLPLMLLTLTGVFWNRYYKKKYTR